MSTETGAGAPPRVAAGSADRDRFVSLVVAALASRQPFRLVLSDHRGPEPDLLRMEARPVDIRGTTMLALVSRYRTRDVTSNVAREEVGSRLNELLASHFRRAHLSLEGREMQLAISKRGKALLRTVRHEGLSPQRGGCDEGGKGGKGGEGRDGGNAVLAHNREKPRPLSLDRPFLHALGITDSAERLVPAMARKWKQINRFIEVFEGAWRASALARSEGPLRLVDFGAGKGYLTFALHDWLRNTRQVDARMTGVEIRPDLVAAGNRTIAALGIEGLEFVQGDIAGHDRPADVLIALHACDTATDEAMYLGIRTGAAIIMCAPCCHKQVRPQLLSPHPLRSILQHGIHLGQEAEMVTDGLRALLLEANGYDTQVFEFVSLEHTAKNKMILAVRRSRPVDPAPLLAQVRDIKSFYGIREQRLETLLQSTAPA